jgi:hypothetical protein
MAKQVASGDKFQFSAKTYNEMNRLIESQRMAGLSAQSAGTRSAKDHVLVKNISGTDVPRFGVLGIGGIVFDPQTSLPAFTSRTAFNGVMPAEAHQAGRFLICAEPIRSGGIGRAWADGIVTCRVDIVNETHPYATIKPDDVMQLISADQGLCYILWKEPGTGTKWAVVRFSSIGSSLQWAFCAADAAYGNTLECFLSTDKVGTLITVYFTLVNCTALNDGHLSLRTGTPIPVMRRDGQWWCIIPIEGTEVVI